MTPNYLSVLYLDDLCEQAERFLLASYERLPRSFVLHNDSWGFTLGNHAREIALRRAGASPDLPPLCQTIALLEACRYWNHDNQLRPLADVLQDFREWTGPDYLNLQLTLRASLSPGGPLNQEIQDVLYDAQLAQRIMSGSEGAELSWLEARYRGTADHDQLPYLKAYLLELRDARFRDATLRRQYQHTHSAILLELQRLIDRQQRRGQRAVAPKGGVAATQTYFRTVFRNHVQLAAIADRKAAMMISINAILIGANITFLSYRNWAQTKPEILLPVSVFIVCALASITYAILSSLPGKKDTTTDDPLHFANIGGQSEEVFRDQLGAVIDDAKQLYGSLTTSIHEMGSTLDRRYGLLRSSYLIFLGGLLVSSLLFLVVLGL